MKRFLVWGLGRSGRAAVSLLKSRGFKVYCGDDARGDRWEDYIDQVDVVVLSPGVPPSHPLWRRALKKEIEVIGETELAYRFFKGRVIAVTGTDGKSTTTRLTYLFLSSYLKGVMEGGNIGKPFSEIVLEAPDALAVLEVSSFQGKTLKSFRPCVGAFLNFSPDHLDWHKSLEDYLESKRNIFANQKKEDVFIYNGAQREVRETPTEARKIDILEVSVGEGAVCYRGKKLFNPSKLKLRGKHNLLNATFASLIAMHFGVPSEIMDEVLSNFSGLRFRLEKVTSLAGVEIYNDSKSTTPHSLKSALESFPDGSVILIAGGKDKGADFSVIRDSVERKVIRAFLIGETREKIKEVIEDLTEVKLCSSLEEAVKLALLSAKEGTFVVFSPGCASFDMFSSYIERGETFNKLVFKLLRKISLTSI